MNSLNNFVFCNTNSSIVSYKLSKDDVERLNDSLDAGCQVKDFCMNSMIFRPDNLLVNGTPLGSFEGFINRHADGECEVFIVNLKNLLNRISSFRI